MSVKTTLTLQEDFTGEFPAAWAESGLWRFNESEPDSNDRLMDSSGHGRDFNIIHWSGTTANMMKGWRGYYSVSYTHLVEILAKKVVASCGA